MGWHEKSQQKMAVRIAKRKARESVIRAINPSALEARIEQLTREAGYLKDAYKQAGTEADFWKDAAKELRGERAQLTRERDELEQYKAGLEERLEKIAEAWSDAIQSDLENGVQMLNELAADKFKHDYPSIFAMGEIINHSGEEK